MVLDEAASHRSTSLRDLEQELGDVSLEVGKVKKQI